MTAEDFKAWRKSLGWTQQKAADVLGVTVRAIQKRESGDSPIDKEAALACRYISGHVSEF